MKIKVASQMQNQTQIFPFFNKLLIDHKLKLPQVIKSELFFPVFYDYEKVLSKLSKDNFINFSKKLKGKIPAGRKNQRRWLEFYNILDELIALDDLWQKFKSEPALIDESNHKGEIPDLKIFNSFKLILAEVKHLDYSDEELGYLDEIIKREKNGKRQKVRVVGKLKNGFFNKMKEWIKKARQQINSYNCQADIKIIYIFIRPDESAVVDAFGHNFVKESIERESKYLKSEGINLITYLCNFSISPDSKRHIKTHDNTDSSFS